MKPHETIETQTTNKMQKLKYKKSIQKFSNYY